MSVRVLFIITTHHCVVFPFVRIKRKDSLFFRNKVLFYYISVKSTHFTNLNQFNILTLYSLGI